MGERPPKIELVLGNSGRVFRRWTRVSLQLRLDTLADAFSFDHVDAPTASPQDPTAVEIADSINEGERCRVKVNGKTIMDGYAKRVHLNRGAEDGPTVNVSGSSATADLVRAAALHETGEWENALFEDMAQQICDPFEIKVVQGDAEAGPKQLAELAKRAAIKFRRAAIEPGETAFEFLNKLAKERGLTLTSTPNGDLAYTIGGIRKIRGRLAEGRNIGEGGSRTGDEGDRFQTYRVIGQSAGDDAWHGEDARGGDGRAEDKGVARYMPLVIIGDGTASDGNFEQRAIWERNRRAARSRKATIPVLSWLDPEKNVWAPNKLVDVLWPIMRIEGEVLIEAARLTFDIDSDGGDDGEIDIVHPGAYDPLQAPKSRSNRRLWADWSAP